MKRSSLITTLLFLLAGLQLHATHIVGGELFYDYIGTSPGGKNNYRVTLIVFRDCGPGTADFDGVGPSPAYITVLDADGNNMGIHDIGMPTITRVPPSINSPCMNVPNFICVEEGVYTYTLSLEPKTGGYYIVYQRCCRNHSILNLTVPGNQGSTYYAFVPGPELAAVNSSPRFKDYPPIFLCMNFDFSYAQAATDPDGDQLVYKFSTPFQGLDACCPSIGAFPSSGNCSNPPDFCPTQAPPAPYPPVIYANPYSPTYPAPASPKLAIDAVTGAMSGAPSLSGQFVVNVSVEEYRNGKLLGRHFRDFQFNMVPCDGVLSQFKNPEKCEGLSMNFTNTSFNGDTYKWDFGVPGDLSDTSSLANPNYLYPDTGLYLVSLIVNPGQTCSDTDQKVVRVYPPLDISFDKPEKQCLVNNSFNFKTLGTYGEKTSFKWHFTDGADPAETQARDPSGIKFKNTGNFFIKLVATHFACVDSCIDTLVVLSMPQVEIAEPGVLCEPASVRLKNKVANDGSLALSWETSHGFHSTDAEPEVVFEKAGVYTTQLIGTANDLCSDTSVLKINVYPYPVSKFEVDPPQVTILEPEVKIKSLVIDAVNYLYDFGDGTGDNFISGTHYFYDEGEYTITQYITNYYGCTDSSSQVVKVLPEHRFWIPNTFTPDNNSLNDTFGPFILGVSHYVFEVFSRWGERIFFSTDPYIGWDGTSGGKKCPQGVYAYKLSYKNTVDGTPEFRLGHVTLLRNE